MFSLPNIYEKIVVNCQTEDEARNFVNQCYDNGIKWYNGNRFMTNYDDCNKNTCYCCIPTRTHESYIYNVYMRLYYCDINYYYDNSFQVIPYSEINKSIKEENKVQIKPNEYTYRGQAFSDVEEYAKYILKCKEEDRVKAEKERQDKLKAEELKRENEVIKAYNEYTKTCNEAKEKYEKIAEQYEKDYGSFNIRPYPSLNELFNGLDRVFKL